MFRVELFSVEFRSCKVEGLGLAGGRGWELKIEAAT